MGVEESGLLRRLLVIAAALSLCVGLGFPDSGLAQPKGQMIIAVDFSLAPTFFDPAETPAMGTPYVILYAYALHDDLIKPLPGNAMAPCLAESWTESADGLSVFSAAVWFIAFNEQWDPKSPWSDRRVRLAAAHAVDMQAINESERLGFSRLTGVLVHRDEELSG